MLGVPLYLLCLIPMSQGLTMNLEPRPVVNKLQKAPVPQHWVHGHSRFLDQFWGFEPGSEGLCNNILPH